MTTVTITRSKTKIRPYVISFSSLLFFFFLFEEPDRMPAEEEEEEGRPEEAREYSWVLDEEDLRFPE